MSTRTIARPSRRRDRSWTRASTSGSSGTRQPYCDNPGRGPSLTPHAPSPAPLAPGPHDALGSGPRPRPGLVVRRRPRARHSGVRRPRRPEHQGRLRPDHRPGRPADEPGLPRRAHPRRHGRPDPAADGAGRLPHPARRHTRSRRPRLERRQPAADRLERHPRPQPADLLHQPLRRPAARHRLPAQAGSRRPVHRPGPAGARSPVS